MLPTIAASFSILGVVVGAFLHSYFARQNNEAKQLLESRNQAYVDFLESVSLVVAAQRSGQKQLELEQLAKLTHANSRICIFGEESVVQKLAEFWSAGASLKSETQILAFTRLCLDIRKSLGIKDKNLLTVEISNLLFSVKVRE